MNFTNRPTINLGGLAAAGAALVFLIFATSTWEGRLRGVYGYPLSPVTSTGSPAVQTSTSTAAQPATADRPSKAPQVTPTTAVFQSIYDTKLWGTGGGGSGDGSTLDYTRRTRLIVELLVTRYGIKTMLDAPCGAMAWMPFVVDRLQSLDPGFSYVGMDVVPTVISSNKATFQGRNGYSYETADFGAPEAALEARGAELVWCRDALQHLPLNLIVNALENFSRIKSAKYLAVGSYKSGNNFLIAAGEYFSIDLRAAPFGLDAPEDVLDEETPDGKLVLVYGMEYLREIDYNAMRQRAGAVGLAGAAKP